MKITRALLIRFSRDECTKDEELAIREWLHDGVWPLLPEGEEIPGDIREKVWNKLQGGIYNPSGKPADRSIEDRSLKMRKTRRNLLGAAAVLLALVGTAIFIYYNHAFNGKKQATFVAGIKEHRKVVLPDSSVVFLSPYSSIKVLQPYAKGKREMVLTGQAVFEVAHNASGPFTVITGDIRTSALGTSFKVTSYPHNKNIKVALSYGKVVVKDQLKSGRGERLYLDPGEEIVYNKTTRIMHKKKVPPRQFDYKSNVLYFKNAGVQEVVEKLERYYHVAVQYNTLKNADWSVSGEFDYQPLQVVMKAVAYSCDINYEIKGNRLILMKK